MRTHLMKLGFAFYLLGSGINTQLQAQHSLAYHQDPSKLDRMRQHLDLTDDQVIDIKTNMAHLDAQELPRHERRNAKKEMLATVITTEQMAELKIHKKAIHQRHHKHHKQHKQHRRHMWYRTNDEVQQKLIEMRTALDKNITAEDKIEIAQLRKAAKALGTKWALDKETFNETSEERIAQLEQEMQSRRAAKNIIAQKAQKLADKYHPEIIEIFKENDRFFVEMKAEKRIEKSKTHKFSNHCMSIPRESLEIGRPYALHKRIGFLLMNATDRTTTQLEDITPLAPQLRLYPNPSTTETQILYQIHTPTNVRINLLDQDGKLLRELSNRHHEAGEYTIKLNATDLISNAYYINLTDNENNQITEKLLIQK